MPSFTDKIMRDFRKVENMTWDSISTALRQTYEDMVNKCPVLTGYLRWRIHLTTFSPTELNPPTKDPNRQYPRPKTPKNIQRSASYTFWDDAPYADIIEYESYSKKVPNGFMRIALLEFPMRVSSEMALRRKGKTGAVKVTEQ